MMFHNDYRLNQYIAQRQIDIRRTAQQANQPSTLRVRTGLALISLGERLRGCAPVATTPTRRLHTTPRVAA